MPRTMISSLPRHCFMLKTGMAVCIASTLPVFANAAVTTLLPRAVVTTSGTASGQAVATSIGLLDSSGTTNTWNRYIEFSGLNAQP